MRRITLKILVALITFVIGVVAATLWFIYRTAPPQAATDLSAAPILSRETEEAEEYAVSSALIKDIFVKDDVKLLVISDSTLFYANPDYLKSTTSEQRIQDMKKYYPSVADETFRDFESKHMEPSKLSPKFDLPVKYVLINEAEYRNPSGEDAYNVRAFYKKYPDARGLIRVSRVGFNKGRNQALVRLDFILCPLCSHGEKVLLKKEMGTWKVIDRFGGWVS